MCSGLLNILGSIASFNWDTTSTTALTLTTALSNPHLSNQNYNICIRRAKGFCSICFTPKVLSTANSAASSFGVSTSDSTSAPVAESATESICTGITKVNAIVDDATNIGN